MIGRIDLSPGETTSGETHLAGTRIFGKSVGLHVRVVTPTDALNIYVQSE